MCYKFIFGERIDGHTIDKSTDQVRRIYGRKVRILACDRGYRGQERVGDTKVMIPDIPRQTDSAYTKAKKHKLFRKRAGIEPVIGHCKSDHRLGRNFYKGLFSDCVNVMLAAVAFNFKRAMRLFLCLVENIAETIKTAGQILKTVNMPDYGKAYLYVFE